RHEVLAGEYHYNMSYNIARRGAYDLSKPCLGPGHSRSSSVPTAGKDVLARFVGDVVQHGDHLGRLQLRAKQRGPLPLRKPCFTGPAVQQAQMLVFPIAHADGQVVSPALAIVMAVLIVTAKPCEIVHRFPSTCTACL